MLAQIALQRLRPVIEHGDLHGAKRAGNHATLTADTAGLFHAHRPLNTAYRPDRANIGARRIFAVMAGHCRRERTGLYHANACGKRGGFDDRAILVVLVRHHTGHFTGAAANALTRIGDNKTVHSPLRLTQKNKGARKRHGGALIAAGKVARFVICMNMSGALP
ncbi:Hypothetical protein AKI40_0156 [Enterobacter sp. FY-07]|nr:Hypothetical protein AKI40_0156 [Enterobacter sp. FY-07]